MLKIGDFSKLAQISIRMLRHYDEIDLIKPVIVDELTGYRFYEEGQLEKINQISLYKNMGFTLKEIQQLVTSNLSEQQLQKALLTLQTKNLNLQATTQKQLQLIENTLADLTNKRPKSKFAIQLKKIPARQVISLRKIIPSYQQEGSLWQEMGQFIKNQKIKFKFPTYSLAIFHDEVYRDEQVDIEIQMSITGTYQANQTIQIKQVPETLAATTLLKGDYAQMTLANEVFAHWFKQNQYEIAAPMFNIYHVGPGETTDSTQWVTEVCYPVAEL